MFFFVCASEGDSERGSSPGLEQAGLFVLTSVHEHKPPVEGEIEQEKERKTRASCPFSFLPSLIPTFLHSNSLYSFLLAIHLSFLPKLLLSILSSFLPPTPHLSLLPSFFPCFPPSLLLSILPFFLPCFLHSFLLPSILPPTPPPPSHQACSLLTHRLAQVYGAPSGEPPHLAKVVVGPQVGE